MSQVLGYARESLMSLLLTLSFGTFFWHFFLALSQAQGFRAQVFRAQVFDVSL